LYLAVIALPLIKGTQKKGKIPLKGIKFDVLNVYYSIINEYNLNLQRKDKITGPNIFKMWPTRYVFLEHLCSPQKISQKM
jgi:hypothetical protein